MSEGQFARLSAASKILFDRELLELRREHEALMVSYERLEFKLFLKSHSVKKLRTAIERVGRLGIRLAHPRTETLPGSANCTRHAWFTGFANYHGLEVVRDPEPDLQRGKCTFICDVDAHFVIRDGHGIVGYGSKLWKAQSIRDPEAQKLKLFMEKVLNMSWPQ